MSRVDQSLSPSPNHHPALRVEGLSKIFGSGRTRVAAVQEVSMEIDRGEVVLMMGPSGSGKTTLLLMLGGLLRPSSGRIVVDGEEMTGLGEARLPELRLRRFGFVFQDFNLLGALTARENVQVVLDLAGVPPAAARDRAESLLGDFDLDDRLDFKPAQLSGGEKQRVAIARALANDPAVVLADEPTANLDSHIGHEVARLLRRIAREQERSVLVVSHDHRLREHSDRVLWLEDGRLKSLTSRHEDPVCAMSVDPEKAVTAVWGGQEYYFCAAGCRDEFLSSPERFVQSGEVATPAL
jgi:putative ABC transport system ATP-binding protein